MRHKLITTIYRIRRWFIPTVPVNFYLTLLAEMRAIRRLEIIMAGKYDALITEVAETRGVVESTKAILTKLVADLIAAQDDPAELEAIVADLAASNDDLAAAVAAVPQDEVPGE